MSVFMFVSFCMWTLKLLGISFQKGRDAPSHLSGLFVYHVRYVFVFPVTHSETESTALID